MKLLKLFLILAVAVLPTLLFTAPVLAIDSPDGDFAINAVYAYQNCVQDGDQLYIVDYTIEYTSNPTEDATEAFKINLLDGTDILHYRYPYVYDGYNDDGYSRGVTSFYLSPDEALTWEDIYTMQLIGNPSLSWSGDIPEVSVSSFDERNSDTTTTIQGLISDRVIALAEVLDRDWDASVSLLQTLSEGTFLSAYGVEYFGRVMGSISLLAPYALADVTFYPDMFEYDFDQDYSDQLESDISGTPFDLTDLATEFGTSRGTITGILYYLVVLFLGVLLVHHMGTYKPVILLLAPLVIMGAFVGVPLVVTIIIAFICLFLIAMAFFYKPSTA